MQQNPPTDQPASISRNALEQRTYTAPKAAFAPIVINGKLAFKFDPNRGLIEWQHRGAKVLIDLSRYEEYRG